MRKFIPLIISLMFFASTSAKADSLDHSSIASKFYGGSYDKKIPLNFDENEYIINVSYFRLNNNMDKGALIAVGKDGEDPFLVLVDSSLYFNSYVYGFPVLKNNIIKSITLDSCIRPEELSNDRKFMSFLKEVVRVSIENTSISYLYIKFDRDPYEINSLDLSIDSRVANILKKGNSLASRLEAVVFVHIINDGNTSYRYTYSTENSHSIYDRSLTWINHLTIRKLFQSLEPFSEKEEARELLSFLSETLDILGLEEDDSFSRFYKKIEKLPDNILKKEITAKLKYWFFNYQNPLLHSIIQDMFDQGLKKGNTFHAFLAKKLLSEKKSLSTDTINKYLGDGELNFDKKYSEVLDSQLAELEKHKDFPVEKKLFESKNKEELLDFLNARNFLLYPSCNIDQYNQMRQEALDYLNVPEKDQPTYLGCNIARTLEKYIEDEGSWNSYLWGYDPLPGEVFIKWFLCMQVVSEYDNDFYYLKSFWPDIRAAVRDFYNIEIYKND